MKVKYVGDSYKVSLIKGKTYDVIGMEDGFYRIVDETEDDFLFSPVEFEVIK